MYVKNDETGVVEHKDMEDGPFVPPNFEAIGNPETWIHMNPNILTSGRVTNYRPSDKTEEDFEEENGKLNEIEQKHEGGELVERLVGINTEVKKFPL